MALSDAEFTELQTILQGLEPKLADLGQSSRGFVSDQIDRERQWGQDMRLSPKQWTWLRDLYSKHCGSLPAGGRTAAPMGEDEIDDEIPF